MVRTSRKKNNAPIEQPAAVQPDSRGDRIAALFASLDTAGDGTLAKRGLIDAISASGIELTDPRLRESMAELERLGESERLDLQQFSHVVKPNAVLIERVLSGELVIPQFDEFCGEIGGLFERASGNDSGAVANYIPQLASVAPDQFGLSLCSVDGQRQSFGDAQTEFCVQSCCKPVNYCLALEEQGDTKVRQHVGCEPSGQSFNELTLNSDGRPHNPLINAGAIMACSLIRPESTAADRFDHVQAHWQQLCGGVKPGFSNPVYLSERRTADRNFALGYFMRESGAFPAQADLIETLEFYFQCCSLESTTERMSVLAATLANGGICPTTGERVFRPDTVQKCLSLMYSCGMYDFSGEWAFTVGLPAKSGVSGAILVVVPNVLGLCIWSPRLDRCGNSVRGVDFCRALTDTFNFHNYDNLTGGCHDKLDPRRKRGELRRDRSVEVCWAASEGDLSSLQRLVAQGVDLDQADYDGRTALHLAASEGHLEVVEFFIAQGASLAPRDRWGGTPLEDARREGHDALVERLERATKSSTNGR